MKFISFSFLLMLASCSCSEELPNYSKEQMLAWSKEADPNMRVEVSTDISKTLVDCRLYTPRCRIGYRVVIKEIKFNALYYEDQKNALVAAKRLKGYYARNWVFDEVRGEPILERIVVKFLKGKPAF